METEEVKAKEEIVKEIKPLKYYVGFYRTKGSYWEEISFSLSKSKESVEESIANWNAHSPNNEFKIVSFEVDRS
ncbi:hypothetical protein KAR91_73290 [Candidatus Pacearchaeota archaeon]|nr:hypothetical protein [Candidatus Pacearchaeota archaeon]